MFIKDIYKAKKPVISFEVFPPNERFPVEKVYDTIDELVKFEPDFISVTYGAGGTTRGRTVEIASRIKNVNNTEVLAHLTCIGADKGEINDILDDLHSKGVENVLALRGDYPSDGSIPEGEFKYAYELVKQVNEKGGFSIGGAFYPEGHLESNDLMDLFYLKRKTEEGTDFLISQIFFDNQFFYDFKKKAEKMQIDVPLVAGIMPVTDAKQIKRITALCGSTIPPKFQRMLDKYEDNPKALKDAGIAYAVEQIVDLIASGVDGIHLYTMNRVDTTQRIMDAITNLR
jgi:methylenetetrahydrofolate reductase (NADPH)